MNSNDNEGAKFDILRGIDVFVIARHQKLHPNLGISRSIRDLVAALQFSNMKVCLITEGDEIEVLQLNEGLFQLSIPKNSATLLAMWKLRLPHPVAAWIQRLELEIDFRGIVIMPVVGLQSMLCSSSSTRNAKKIVTLHSPYSKWSPIGALYFYLQKNSLNYADFIVANSNAIGKKFDIAEGMTICNIPHHVKRINIISTKNGANEHESMRFLWIGSLSHRKGTDRLLRLLLLNAKRNKIDIVWSKTRFSIVYEITLKFLSRAGWVKLHTNLADNQLTELIQVSNGLLTTSRFESFGMTIVEAGLLAKPLIGISAPGVVETLPAESGGAHYFKSVKELEKFMSTTDEPELVGMGFKARDFCVKMYGIEVISNKWEQLIKQL